MQKISTMQTSRKNLFQGQLTVGVDLGGHERGGTENLAEKEFAPNS
jgi:hypothetical protein